LKMNVEKHMPILPVELRALMKTGDKLVRTGDKLVRTEDKLQFLSTKRRRGSELLGACVVRS
jgi:hypothetical protein